MKLLKSTTNPFVNVAINIANNRSGFDKSSFQLIDFLLDNQKFQYFDLNEKVLVNDDSYYNKLGDYYSNFFNIIFMMDNSFNPQLMNKIINHGLIFDPFYRNINNEIIGDILFSRTELSSDRNIFLFNLYLKQYGLENFSQQLVKYNTLNKCVAQKNLDVVEFLLKHVSVNLLNENLESPIMFSRNLSTLKFLSSYQPDWEQKNIFGQNCSYFFSGIQNDKEKKEMLEYYFQELSKNSVKTIADTEYIEKKLKEALLNLVSKNATKGELQLFLKKYKLKDVESITNSNNRTLGHICVANEDFARFDLFPNTDLYHVDNNGYNIFTTLFFKNNFSSSTKLDKAKKILLKCLNQPEKNINEKNINQLIEFPFHTYNSNPLPDWILKDHSLRIQTLKVFNVSSNDIDFSSYINKYSTLNAEDKNRLYFDLLSNSLLKYDLNILKKDNFIHQIFDTKEVLGGYEHYFNKNSAENLFLLLEKCENIGKINLINFLNDAFSDINSVLFQLKKSFMVYNKEIYETTEALQEINNQNFYKEVCIPFFEFLNNKKAYSVIEKIDEDLINQTLKIDLDGDLNEFLKTFSYLKLKNKLTPKNIKSTNKKI